MNKKRLVDEIAVLTSDKDTGNKVLAEILYEYFLKLPECPCDTKDTEEWGCSEWAMNCSESFMEKIVETIRGLLKLPDRRCATSEYPYFEKIACIECENCIVDGFSYNENYLVEYRCKRALDLQNFDPISGKYACKICSEVNKDGNCPHFKQKESEFEKLFNLFKKLFNFLLRRK